jgi:hypothetical protein
MNAPEGACPVLLEGDDADGRSAVQTLSAYSVSPM